MLIYARNPIDIASLRPSQLEEFIKETVTVSERHLILAASKVPQSEVSLLGSRSFQHPRSHNWGLCNSLIQYAISMVAGKIAELYAAVADGIVNLVNNAGLGFLCAQ